MSESVTKESIELLSTLIRNKCVNPPGNEMKSIKTIQSFLQERNIECEVFESAPNRGNLVAKVKGTIGGPKLMFGPSHVDVVPVDNPNAWKVDPFGGIIKDGYIWGRGALDMLFIVVAQVQAFIKLFNEKTKPKGDIILLIVSDEEAGGTYGTAWMIKNQSELIKADYAVSEHGGLFFAPDKFILIVGEKGNVSKRITFKGPSGHGAMPFGVENPLVKASEAVKRLSSYKPPINTVYIDYLAKGLEIGGLKRHLFSNKLFLDFFLNKIKSKSPTVARVAHGLSRMTISPNVMIVDEPKINVIPSRVHVDVDIRPLPGQDNDYVVNQLEKALGSLRKDATIETIEEGDGFQSYGTESPVNSKFVTAMEEAIQMEFPNSKMMPFIYPPASDLRLLRPLGTQAYGFSLFDPNTPVSHLVGLAHSVDERISIKTLELSTKAYYNLAKIFLLS